MDQVIGTIIVAIITTGGIIVNTIISNRTGKKIENINNLKYEIYKCQRVNNNPVIEDTGNYYLISLPINGLEYIKSKVKYERA